MNCCGEQTSCSPYPSLPFRPIADEGGSALTVLGRTVKESCSWPGLSLPGWSTFADHRGQLPKNFWEHPRPKDPEGRCFRLDPSLFGGNVFADDARDRPPGRCFRCLVGNHPGMPLRIFQVGTRGESDSGCKTWDRCPEKRIRLAA